MEVRGFFLVATLVAVPTSGHAVFFCSEPEPPYCVDGYGYFEDQWEFESCRSQVEQFVSDVDEYVDCLRREQNEKIEEANQAIEKFNCRAEGNSYC